MRVATAAQLAQALGMSLDAARRRLRVLGRLGLVRASRPWAGRPAVYAATRAGAGAAGLGLGPARVRLGTLRHDLRVGELAVALLRATPGARWVSEREIRRQAAEEGLAGGPHVPDGLLLLPDGTRVAVELELTPKTRRHLLRILRFYARSRAYDRVRYLTPDPGQADRLRALAHHLPHVEVGVWPDG